MRASLTNFNTLDFLVEKINVTVVAECPNSLLKPLNLTSQSLSTDIRGTAAQLQIQLPQDSSSLVLGDQGGYSYCGDRKLFA